MLSPITKKDSIVEGGVVNVSSVAQYSPFRYPGGKTWLVPTVKHWLSQRAKPKTFVEPFAGGGIVSLTVAIEGLADSVVMIERDPYVASVWRTILSNKSDTLAERILDFKLNRKNAAATLASVAVGILDSAFQTILRNRVQRGGILAPGASLLKEGENGKGIKSRWYPETLAKRIRAIAAVRDRIKFIEGDAMRLIPQFVDDPRTTFFIDPPYTASRKRAGSRLYLHSEIDHKRLFELVASAKGAAMLTYDDAPEVEELANAHRLKVGRVPMKSTHHRTMFELVIAHTPSSG
jgi:DNA adenine methylase